MRRRIFIQFLVTYLSFTVLMAVLYVPLYQNLLKIYTQRSKHSGEIELRRGLDQLESTLEAQRTVVQAMMNESSISQLSYIQTPFSGRDTYLTVTALRTYSAFASQTVGRANMGLVLPNNLVLLDGSLYSAPASMYMQFSYPDFGSVEEWLTWL
ncbi:MAG TPA: hypothetical protein GXZ59_08170, partial [Clostridiaceae bacterium]|nr:hypothetical protein [Clostridiaceae bacterium]